MVAIWSLMVFVISAVNSTGVVGFAGLCWATPESSDRELAERVQAKNENSIRQPHQHFPINTSMTSSHTINKLQPGEFLDDPSSLLDDTYLAYDSHEEYGSDASADLSPQHPDGHLTIVTDQPNRRVFNNGPSQSASVQTRVALFRCFVEHDQDVWNTPNTEIHVPVLRDRVTLVYRDFKERFRVVVRARDLREDIYLGPYLVRLTTQYSRQNQLVISDVHLREPLKRPPLMI